MADETKHLGPGARKVVLWAGALISAFVIIPGAIKTIATAEPFFRWMYIGILVLISLIIAIAGYRETKSKTHSRDSEKGNE